MWCVNVTRVFFFFSRHFKVARNESKACTYLRNSRNPGNVQQFFPLPEYGIWGVLSRRCHEYLYRNCVSLQTSLFTKYVWHVFPYLLATRFFISNTLVNNARLKLTKNQAKAKQHPTLNFCYLKIIRSLPRYPKIIGGILKNVQKTSTVIWLMTMKMMLKIKKRSQVRNK